MGFAVIHEIAVEIDVFLCHPAQPCKTMAVKRMDQDQAHVGRQLRCFSAFEHAGKNTRSAESFDAVGRRIAEEDVGCAGIAEQGNVRGDEGSVRPGRSGIVGADFRAGLFGGGAKPVTALRVIRGKIVDGGHGGRA
jgi:hypothetical protein